MKLVTLYALIFLIVFLVLYVFQYLLKRRKDELGLAKNFVFITRKYNLSMNKKRVRTLSMIIILTNTFIISVPMFIVLVGNINYFFAMFISLVICIILIIVMYNLIGYILKKKGW